MEQLLLVDDDTELCEMLTEYLAPEGFEIIAAHDGQAGLECAAKQTYALVILDVMLPRLDGFEVLRQLRQGSTPNAATPVLMLTARGDDDDRIVGLEMGADDYLGKPFNPRELTARLNAILRRTRGDGAEDARELLSNGGIEVDVPARSAKRDGVELDITSTEFDLLLVLMRAAGEVVSREQLAEQVFERKLLRFDRTIDMHVSNLRKKLGPTFEGLDRIKTIRGTGYLYAKS